MNVHWTTFNRLCKPPQKKNKQLKEQWVDIKTFYARDNVSQELPLARAKGQRYMTKTLEEAYHMYTEHFAKSGKKCVSFSTFCKMRPRNIYKIGQTPDCQCMCDTCENFRLLHQSIKNYLIKGIEHHTDTCIKQSLCPVLESESNAESNLDGLNQVNPHMGTSIASHKTASSVGQNWYSCRFLKRILIYKHPLKWCQGTDGSGLKRKVQSANALIL